MLDGLADGSVIRLSDDQTAPDGTKISAMRAWNYYRSKTDYFGDTSAQTTILNGLVAQSDALIKTLCPDTFRNYALICMAADGTDHCDHLQFVIGSMGRTGGEQAPVTRTDTSAAYSDIVFTLPDAWASYTLTITNKGTADAHLSDYLNLYYRYYGDKAVFGSEQMSETATRVVDGFLRDAAEVLRQQYPDAWPQ